MTKLYLLLFGLCSLIGLCVGEIVLSGQCDPNIPVVPDFQLEKFDGTWFELERSESPEQRTNCAQFDFTLEDNAFVVRHFGLNNNFAEESWGTATVSSSETAKMELQIPIFEEPMDFWILYGGNGTVSVTYSCKNISPSSKSIHLWVLGKDRDYPGEMAIEFVNTVLRNLFGFGVERLQTVDHGDNACFKLPEINPGDEVILDGKCNTNIPVQQNFNVEAFAGTWHQTSSYYTESSTGNCARAVYGIGDGVVDVTNSQVIDEKLLTITGYAVLTTDDNSAKLKVVLNVPTGTVEQDLYVLSTDYHNYAVSYSCEDLENDKRRIYSWILSRERTLRPEIQSRVNEVINSNLELNSRFYVTTDQSPEACFYYPEPNGGPVVFRGQCDMSIPVVQNFETEKYMGLWHNIELYPAQFQDGECSNAFYELRDGGVGVRNTQVVKETLDVITAFAVPTFDDGSAKLRVTFPVAGTDFTITTDYWVLATNYESFALVYSCSNRDDDNMQVSSWKLSRSKSLSPADNDAITTTMNTIKVLRQKYFEPVNQSKESCAFIPTPEEGVPVVFPGECDPNIGMESFDLSRFAGVWHEIESYPKLEQTGECINHNFISLTSTSSNLLTSSVDDQFLVQTQGSVISTDSSGRLTITINTGGEDINIPFWIIGTDYSTYALAYACVDREDGLRGVWSWKLSKTKELTEDATEAINNYIADIDVLDNKYYWPVDQNDRACSTLPVLEAGAPIILDGICDTNIAGVTDFNPTRFSGPWRSIQSYPSDLETGSCSEVNFNEVDALNFAVTYAQVIERNRSSIFGSATVNSGRGSLQIAFPGSIEAAEYLILGVDYDSYALLYRCENLENTRRRVWSWKLSRNNLLGDDANADINSIIREIEVLNNRYYANVDRTTAGCFYFPEVNPNSPVQFRDRCDMNIPVVMNFNAPAYMGLWHDIESYPEVFQDGTCNNANYTLDDDVVEVFNTQVVNEYLDTMTGRAVPVGSDGSAKLEVTFNVGGSNVSTNYWVLDTDYDSFSLVYSCRPVNDEYIQVTTWKLSRNKTLSDEANIRINAIMESIPVLDQRYYVKRNQSDDGCFYLPEPDDNKPVIFPGACNEDINTVEDFSLSEFSGVWYEIEAYPKDEQTGECIRHEYFSNDNLQADLISSSVRDQIRDITSGRVTSSNGGKLTINIEDSNGESINIPLWIIAVNYADYALAYSCINRGDRRAVYSWKLSRSKQLSSIAKTAINAAMADIRVIDDRYFKHIDQKDEACFYLPDRTPGLPAIFPGKCDESIRGKPNFNVNGLIGRWRVLERYPSENEGTCNEARYSSNDMSTINAVHAYVDDATLKTASGTLRVVANDGSGTLQFSTTEQTHEYIVLETDYNSYAFVYQCENVMRGPDQYRRVMSWKLSRDKSLNENANEAINNIMNTIDVLVPSFFYSVNNTEDGCFYFPEVNRNTPVRFRGSCDESIPVEANFNVNEYMGMWHDIQSYPEVFQGGTCSNAYYSLTDGGVSVYNTQVVNQQLDVMTGTAVVASVDGSAKLDVTFNVNEVKVTTKYWVLATDYKDYALVYSCRPAEDEYIQVTSWKLSRNKFLSSEANEKIDEKMKTIRVLDDRYYVERNQTESGCFYFPEPVENEPVVFRGQCNEDIDTVQNFDISKFSGVWREMEKYPYAVNDQCVDHRFELESSAVLNYNSYHVSDENLILVNSKIVNLTPIENNGKLNINIVVDGQVIAVPFWILDTDYEDYALAYGCRNLNDDSRQIYSWKLSRTRQQTISGSAAIEAAMERVDVLRNEYFNKIQQTDEACFYLPELGHNDPVTFIGLCDQNIRAVSNFDATRYLGRWRLIETYFAEFQYGTCSEAEYIQGTDSVVVINSQVEDQRLLTLTGSAVVASTDGSGKLLVFFPGNTTGSEYWILGTDYNNYALVYSCQNINNDRRRVWSWKMSRTNTLIEEATDEIDKIVNSVNVLNDKYYQKVNRTDEGCFYFPPADVNTPVVFPGQCDPNIPVVGNFDAAAYGGIWYGIESYPAPFQTGTCSKANYTLNGDGTVTVVNTQVSDQLLETWIGSAVLTETDGTAKLSVTFNVNGVDVTTSYWVLATDYDDYALVYSCENLDEFRRSVFSWKLSRTKSLTDDANEAINKVIDTIDVLQQEYYFKDGHTDNDCFYYPDNFGGNVILPGKCLDDIDVPAVETFNAQMFAGRWYEVARFPSDIQVGGCASTEYSLSGTNTFSATRSFVIDERLQVSTLEAFAAEDGRGVIKAEIDGVPFDSVYILGIDYGDYALAYSCKNLEDNEKQIFSWKLSRNRNGLSDAGNNAIDELVSDNIDLWGGYYQTTRQDFEACFYYPEFDGIPEVIDLPGPCPNNINGVPNFNAAAYLGRWYEIAKYPVRNQPGQCNRAKYTLETVNGVDRVAVNNEEVLEQTLFTQLGYADIASTDGSGQLNVEFIVDGELRTANYYILTTDYSSYSLVYSCMNIPNDWRRVSSWKLSRTKVEISGVNDMDAVIDATQGLKLSYYQPTSQSDEDCFYIPFNLINRAPRFRGRCENISGVQGFDIQRFLGWWHEIESYEVDGNHEGECRSSEYRQDGNTFRVEDKWVRDNEGSSREGTVVATPDGRLLREMANGEPQEILVLATDYDTYALLYSCEQIDDEYRRIWSAKHSRTRSLTEAAQNAMAPIIDSNSVLYTQFYRNVDQRDNTCFYYPDITVGEVIIPGQCDLSIQTEPNFNIRQFAGVWYQTERYDSVEGSCVGTRYLVSDDDATIRVFDVEVRDEETIRAEGTATVSDNALIEHTFPDPESPGNWRNVSVHVLETDFTNYAVVYTCENVDAFHRQVRAWKLSRARQLSPDSNSAISGLIHRLQVLHQPYFNEIVQAEECPEPSSALLVKSSIVVLLVGAMLQWLL